MKVPVSSNLPDAPAYAPVPPVTVETVACSPCPLGVVLKAPESLRKRSPSFVCRTRSAVKKRTPVAAVSFEGVKLVAEATKVPLSAPEKRPAEH